MEPILFSLIFTMVHFTSSYTNGHDLCRELYGNSISVEIEWFLLSQVKGHFSHKSAFSFSLHTSGYLLHHDFHLVKLL